MTLEGRCVVLGVTGGIAAYKAAEIVSRLKKLGADVRVIMTKNACEFITPLTLETLSANPVVCDTFERARTWEVEHIALAARADLFLIAPATANLMAKMATGLADDMLSTTVLATRAPVLLAPAMNTAMWEHPATQENRERLARRGVRFVGPAEGHLACGTTGKGHIASVEDIVAQACALLCPVCDLQGRRVLVTAGPTREPLDPVRYLTNRSSGKMGYALAEAAAARGAEVTLLTGPVSLDVPHGVHALRFETTQDLLALALEHGPAQDIVIQAAAPADYRAQEVAPHKIKKADGEPLTLSLVENPDVARALGERKRSGQLFVGFAAETNDVLAHARQKLERKRLDLIVANEVTRPGAGFDVDTNIVTLISREDMRELPILSKREVADRILDRVLELGAPASD